MSMNNFTVDSFETVHYFVLYILDRSTMISSIKYFCVIYRTSFYVGLKCIFFPIFLNYARKTWYCIAVLRLRASVSAGDFPNGRVETLAEAPTSTRCRPPGVSLDTRWLGFWITLDQVSLTKTHQVVSTLHGNTLLLGGF